MEAKGSRLAPTIPNERTGMQIGPFNDPRTERKLNLFCNFVVADFRLIMEQSAAEETTTRSQSGRRTDGDAERTKTAPPYRKRIPANDGKIVT